MPRQATYNYYGVSLSIQPDEIQDAETGKTMSGWSLIITDPAEPAQHILSFNDEIKDGLLQVLLGGIIPANASDLKALGSPKVVL